MSELAAIAHNAELEHLRFLVAGGHAVIAHGFPRATFDLDLMISRGDREKWIALARRLGYDFFREGPTFVQLNPPKDGSIPLDLMIVNEDTFAKMEAESVPMPANVRGLRAVSLTHLLATKCHAIKHGHPGRVVKDAEDVIRLVQNNNVDLEEPEIRELFKKHGTDEFYQKVRRACQRED